jgi:hypothetical protein
MLMPLKSATDGSGPIVEKFHDERADKLDLFIVVPHDAVQVMGIP